MLEAQDQGEASPQHDREEHHAAEALEGGHYRTVNLSLTARPHCPVPGS